MKLIEISRLTVAGCAAMLLIACGGNSSGGGGQLREKAALNCPDCDAAGIPVNIWTYYGASPGSVMEQLPHGWPVELAYIKDGDDGRQWAHIIYCTSRNSCDNGYVLLSMVGRNGAVVRLAPTATQRPPATAVPSPTPTVTPIPTATPVVPIVALRTNLRVSPDTNAEIVRRVDSKTALTLIGMTADGEWVQTSTGLWLRSGAMRNVPADLPVVSFITTSLEAMPAPTP